MSTIWKQSGSPGIIVDGSGRPILCANCPCATNNYTGGNLVVLRVGDGTETLANTGNSVFLDEYTTTGSYVRSVAVPQSASGSRLVLTGTATSEGVLKLSPNGDLLCFCGYDAAIPYASSLVSTNGSTVARVLGLSTAADVFDLSTRLSNLASTGNPRSIVAANNVDAWGVGSLGGLVYGAIGTAGAGSVIFSTPANCRDVFILDGELYMATGTTVSATPGVYDVGALPTSSVTPTSIMSSGTTADPSGLWFADADTCYVACSGSIANGGGLQKFTQSGGTWSLAYTLNGGLVTSGTFQGLLTVTGIPGTTNVLYCVTNLGSVNSIVTVTDTGSGASFSTVATAGSATAFRGIAMAPGYQPTVTGVSPSSGSHTGGTSVTITGTNFTPAAAVRFGTAYAASVTVSSSTSITCTSPAGTAGTVDVTVIASGVASKAVVADQFTYT